jgi:hypothetical protein
VHPPELWRDRAFRALWAGQTASLFGDQVTGLALPWLILLQAHSPAAAGAVLAVRYLPLITLGLVAGVVVDRVDRRALMIACDVGRALSLGLVALLAALGQAPSLWLLMLIVLALGTGQLFFSAAYQAWLPQMTGEERLSRAAAALEASDAASVLIGYPLAGALIAAIGPALALGADGLSYVASVVSLIYLRPDHANREGTNDTNITEHVKMRKDRNEVQAGGPPPREPGEQEIRTLRTSAISAPSALDVDPVSSRLSVRPLVAEALAGVRLIFALPAQRLLKVAAAPLYLDAGAVGVLLATLTQLELRLSAWQAGLVFGSMGAGGLISSAFAPRVYHWGWRRGLALASAIAALGSLALAWAGLLNAAHGFAVALVGDLVLDGAVALGFVLVTTANSLTTPAALRGRVNAASAIYSSAMRGLAALGLGALAARMGTSTAFVLLACCFLLAALVALRGRIGESS